MRPPATAVTMHGAQRRQRIMSRVPSLRLLLIACVISFFIGRNTVPISISTQFCQKIIHDDNTPPPPPTLISNRRKGIEKEEFAANNSTSWPSLNVTFRDDRIYPISFGLPTNRYRRTNLTSVKIRDFASILPKKRGQEYTHSNEESYYNSYSESLFGITFKKAGWDCLRHYEIIAAGSIPFFLDIDELPENTMYDFPVDLVKKAMALPGLPSIEAVKHYVEQPTTGTQDELWIDHDVFNITEYYKLRDAIYKHSTEYLTWSAKARYMMQVAQTHYPCIQSSQQPQRVLLISVKDCEYLSCTIWGGFYEEFGTERMSSLLGAKTALFRSLSPAATILYGRGFSYKDTYDDEYEWDEKKMRILTEERIKGGYFNVIIYMNGRNAFCSQKEYDEKGSSLGIGTHGGSSMLHDYQIRYNPLVITVDGNDVRGCHTLFTKDKHPLQSHLHFIREFNSTYHPGMDTPRRWTGCGAPPASAGEPCPFCAKGGIANLDLVVPKTGGNTCRSLRSMATAEYVDGSDACVVIQKEERVCCPDQINNNHLLQQHNYTLRRPNSNNKDMSSSSVVVEDRKEMCILDGSFDPPADEIIIDYKMIRRMDKSLLTNVKDFTNEAYANHLLADPGKEHYPFLSYLSSRYGDCRHFADIGTRVVASALALGSNLKSPVWTFDLPSSSERKGAFRERTEEEWQSRAQAIGLDIKFHNLDLMKASNDELKQYIGTWFVMLDTFHKPDTVPFEREFFQRMIDIGFKGILALDDIHLNSEMKQWWKEVQDGAERGRYHTYDISEIGHYSGTGLVDFSGKVSFLASESDPCPFCEGKGGIAHLDLVVPKTGGNTCRSLKWMATTEYVDGSDACVVIQKEERVCCPDQINNNHLLQQHNFAVTNSQSHAIFWLHIPKTGTSLFNTIYLHFCPSILVKNPSLATQKKPLMDKELLKDYPPKDFCNNVTFANMPRPGFHHPYPKDTQIGEKYFYFTMLRDPIERLRSAYSFGKHLSKLKNDSISFDTYLNESHIPDCELKMILGFTCYDFVDPEHLNISVAVNRIQTPHFFFGITDRWEESICLFHHMYGGSTQPFELKNNRKTKRVETPGNINRTFAETIFFEEALKIFNMRVKEAGC